jgi:hypothetical protein
VDLPTRTRRAATWITATAFYVLVPGLPMLVNGESISEIPPLILIVWGAAYVLSMLAGTPPKVRAGREWISNDNGRTWVRLDALTKLEYDARSLIQMEIRDARRRVRLDRFHIRASPVLRTILADACRDASERLGPEHVRPPLAILDIIGDLPPRLDPQREP